MVAPLKLEGTAGDLKEMTQAEEDYIAYLTGLQLAAMTSADVSALTTTSGGNNIGSYTNTFYDQVVGTHPGTSITSGSTVTTLYQNIGSASEAGADFHRPLRWAGSGAIEEMDNVEFDEIVDRALIKIFSNDFPGIYRLASSSPGADWDVHLSNVFTDTQSSGVTATTYNIYQRQTMTAPTTVQSVKILNDTTAFDGLKQMNATEMQTTFGQRAKTRIMGGANHLGQYQLRSSAQGVPVAAGTWRAVGTATDTKDTTSNVAYSGSYAGTYAGTYTGYYTNSFTGYYTGGFTGSYAGTYSRAFAGSYVGYFTGSYANSFAGAYSSSFAGSYTQMFIGHYGRTSYAPYGPVTNYYSRYLGAGYYTGYYASYYTGYYTGYFSGSYARSFTGYYTGDFAGSYSGTYSRAFAGDYSRNFAGNYTGNYTGSYTGNYTGETIIATDATIETYTLYVRAS